MKVSQYLGRSLVASGLALVLVAGVGSAQQPAKQFEPQVKTVCPMKGCATPSRDEMERAIARALEKSPDILH